LAKALLLLLLLLQLIAACFCLRLPAAASILPRCSCASFGLVCLASYLRTDRLPSTLMLLHQL
jgi:hypothetical protein